MRQTDELMESVLRELAETILRQLQPFILVTEDQDHLRDEAVRKLWEAGYSAIGVSSGDQAIQICRWAKPAGILMDIELGEGPNGIETLKQIHDKQPENAIPALIWTAFRDEYEETVRKQDLPIVGWIEEDVTTLKMRDRIVDSVFAPLRDRLVVIMNEHFQPILDKLRRYEETFGEVDNLEPVVEYTGEVIDVDIDDIPDGVRIALDISDQQDEEKLVRIFPKKQVEAIGAAFPSAQVKYDVYETGATNVSVLRYIGPPREELLKEEPDFFSEDELKVLES